MLVALLLQRLVAPASRRCAPSFPARPTPPRRASNWPPMRSARAACGSVLARGLSLPRILQSRLYARSAGRSHPLPQRPIGLIDLDYARQSLPPRTHHRSPQLVHPGPRSLIAAQPENALQTQRAARSFAEVTCQIARNHSAAAYVCLGRRARGHRRLPPSSERIRTTLCAPAKPAHARIPDSGKPSGQRNADR